MPLPIVFIHQGYREYLWFATRQARLSNPASEIILLGDRRNDCLPFVDRHVLISDYFQEADEFQKSYRHLSTNPRQFELFCVQRWYVLNEFMSACGLDSCFCADSDVMIYSDLSQLQKSYSSFDLTLSKAMSPHAMFLQSRETLEDFCGFARDLYTNPAALHRLEQRFNAHQGAGGICDMTLFNDYSKSGRAAVGESHVIRDEGIIDHNVNAADGFAVHRGIKWFTWIDGNPFGWHEESERSIRFHMIHFQGAAKKRMWSHATCPDLDCYRRWVHSKTTSKVLRLYQSMTRRIGQRPGKLAG